jgi:hypothetical protein
MENFSRDDLILGGVALLLAISLLFFPWYSVSVGPFSATESATSSPYAIWGVLALIASVAFIADLAMEKLSPQTTLPSVGGSRTMTRFVIAGVIGGLLVIKFIAHIGDFGWGFFVCVVALGALEYLAMQARGAGVAPTRPAGPAGPASTAGPTSPAGGAPPAPRPPESPGSSEPPPA